jgi:4-amino-4-deoxychorismate lyase
MSGPLEVLVDGAPCNEGWPQDRGLLYGDGLFETMLARAGQIRFAAGHRARLAEGCRRLAINADLEGIWHHTAASAARHGAATLRLQVTRGEATARGYAPTGREQARAILSVFPPPAPGELPARLAAVTLRQCLGENPDLAGLKHCNRLEQVLARQALAGNGAFEGLMSSSAGFLISGTMSNVFLELDGELVTPSVERCGVAGVVRAVVLREAAQLNLAIGVATLPLAVLARCTAMALSNARLGLVPVHELDGRELGRSPALDQLATRIAAL